LARNLKLKLHKALSPAPSQQANKQTLAEQVVRKLKVKEV